MNNAPDLVQAFRERVLAPMKASLIGKDDIIELLGVALIAGENVFLLGPPGTAKSALVQELAARLQGRMFDYLLSRFTEPSELFGPFDIRKLREGELVTNIDGMLPEADFVFLDELLNANSAILNSLLQTLNEKVFRRGRETLRLPLLMVVAASNRLPEDDALGALFDRFLLRIHCENVDNDLLGDVLSAGWQRQRQTIESPLAVDDIRDLQGLVPQVDLQAVTPSLLELILRLREAGMPVSDRRAVKMQRVIAASAIIAGRREANSSDLWVFRHTWDSLSQAELIDAHVTAVMQSAAEKNPAPQAAHPMSGGDAAPDPQQLHRELKRIEESIASGDESQRVLARDQLAVLGERVEWIPDEVPRQHLREQIQDLLQRRQS